MWKRKKINKSMALFKKIISRFLFAHKNLFQMMLGKPLKPKWLWFELTDRCNSHCTHCHIWRKKPTNNPLTLEEIKKTLSNPLFSGLENIVNSGGEPVLRDDLEQILLAEHEILPQAKIDLSTNGIFSEKVLTVIENVIKKDVSLTVGISLDGVRQNHDRIRGVPGNFQQVDLLVKRLLNLKKDFPEKISVILGFTLSDLTLPYLKEVKEYARENGIEISVQWYHQSSFYENGDLSGRHNEEMMAAVRSLPPTIHRDKWEKWLKNEPIKFKCFAGHTFCALKCNGDVVPCLNFWGNPLGNVRKNTPTQIWQSDQAKEIRKKIIKKCPGCLNSWGVWWSASSCFYPRLIYYLKNPKSLVKRLKEKD